jgi:hypothetical protein
MITRAIKENESKINDKRVIFSHIVCRKFPINCHLSQPTDGAMNSGFSKEREN